MGIRNLSDFVLQVPYPQWLRHSWALDKSESPLKRGFEAERQSESPLERGFDRAVLPIRVPSGKRGGAEHRGVWQSPLKEGIWSRVSCVQRGALPASGRAHLRVVGHPRRHGHLAQSPVPWHGSPDPWSPAHGSGDPCHSDPTANRQIRLPAALFVFQSRVRSRLTFFSV